MESEAFTVVMTGEVLSGSQDAIKRHYVKHFIEKPSPARRRTFLEEGNYY